MKTLLYIMYSMFFILGSCAVQKKSITYTQTSFKVEGNCNMCKNRIESAVMSLSGVKSAQWNVSTKILEITYNPSKMTEDKIHLELSRVGHDTSKIKADDAVYQKLHSCCKYRDQK
jgi:mercuric ion binding protein